MSHIDFYTMKRNEEPQDFKQALTLVHHDDDAAYFVDNVATRYIQGPVIEDGDEVRVINGERVFILQYHNGVGDGGASDICNAEWFAKTYPQAFKLLGVTISWGKGTEALTGSPRGTVG